MAREAGFKEHNGMVYVTTINDDCAEELKVFEVLVRADEREVCAKVCDTVWNGDADTFESTEACNECAAAIRARSGDQK